MCHSQRSSRQLRQKSHSAKERSPFVQREARLPRTHATHSSTVGHATTRPADTTMSAATARDKATLSTTAGNTKTGNTKARNDHHHQPIKQAPAVNARRLNSYLQGYDPLIREALTAGFTLGFRIPSTATAIPTSGYTNHKSALQNQAIVSSKLQKELSLGRIAGPFETPPINGLIISPLGLVPKKAENEYRLIHDLSFPKNQSVNSNIDTSLTYVQYEDLDHCVDIIQSIGPNTLVAKADLRDAFRIIPIHKNDHRLLGFSWMGQYYFDKHLPMGCSVSCQIFESLSTAIQWILQKKLLVKKMSHILDDFIFFGPPDSNICSHALQTFLTLADSLKLPVKHQKTVLPATCVMLHGIEVDTAAMTLRLPQEKLVEAREKVKAMMNRKKTSLKDLQSLLGTLNFACRVVVPGRAFLRRLFDLTKGVVRKQHWIRLTKEARRDLRAWSVFLDSFNGRTLCLPKQWDSSNSMKMYSDASGFAYAAVLGSKWLQGSFPPAWKDVNIAIKELLPIVLAVRMWGNLLANKRILFFTDNEAIVHVINKQSSREPSIMNLVRSLVSSSLINNVQFMAKHIPGKHNIIADHLSRSQVSKARAVAPWLDPHPTSINQEWLPWCKEPPTSSQQP